MSLTLYQILDEEEIKRVKTRTQVRNVRFDDLTVEELKELANVIDVPKDIRSIPDFQFVKVLKYLNVRTYAAIGI
jgi:hypothetical protein